MLYTQTRKTADLLSGPTNFIMVIFSFPTSSLFKNWIYYRCNSSRVSESPWLIGPQFHSAQTAVRTTDRPGIPVLVAAPWESPHNKKNLKRLHFMCPISLFSNVMIFLGHTTSSIHLLVQIRLTEKCTGRTPCRVPWGPHTPRRTVTALRPLAGGGGCPSAMPEPSPQADPSTVRTWTFHSGC